MPFAPELPLWRVRPLSGTQQPVTYPKPSTMNPDAKDGRLSDTPETDALQAQEWKPNWAAHARRLERERDEARAIAKYWQEQYGHCASEHEWETLPWETF